MKLNLVFSKVQRFPSHFTIEGVSFLEVLRYLMAELHFFDAELHLFRDQFGFVGIFTELIRGYHHLYHLILEYFTYNSPRCCFKSHNPCFFEASGKIVPAVTHFVRGEIAAKAANSSFRKRSIVLEERFLVKYLEPTHRNDEIMQNKIGNIVRLGCFQHQIVNKLN